MKIRLITDLYDLLLNHVPTESSAYGCLEKASKIDGLINAVDEYWVDCTPQQADEFLEAAKKHFQFRVREIEQAIVQAYR